MRITGINTAITQGDVIRVHASILSNVPTVVNENTDTFYFDILVTNNTGLSNFSMGPQYRYSMLAHADTFAIVTPSSITWNKHIINYEFVYDDVASFTVGTISIRGAVEDAANSIPVSIYNLCVVIDKS